MRFKTVSQNRYISIDKAIEKGIKVYKVVNIGGKEKKQGKAKVYKRKPPENIVYMINEMGHFTSLKKFKRAQSINIVTIKNGVKNETGFKFFKSKKRLQKTLNFKKENLEKRNFKELNKKELVQYAQQAYKVSGSNVKRFYIWSLVNKNSDDQKLINKIYRENIEKWLDTNLNTVKKQIKEIFKNETTESK